MMPVWDGRFPPPFSIYQGETLLALTSVRDNQAYTQLYRENLAHHLGWNSWQEIMDAGLRNAKIPEPTHCPECGRPFEEEDE